MALKLKNKNFINIKVLLYKSQISNMNINKIVVSNKLTFGKQDFKYFIGCKDDKEIRSLCIFFPEMSMYKIYSDKTKYMHFMIEDENFLIN